MPYSPATDITFGSSATSASVNNRVSPADTYLGLYDDDIESIRLGWIPVTIAGVAETWTYNSVSGILGTVTVATDATTRFQKGDKIKFTQSATVKYFYITAVTSTTITITGGTDYTLTNSAISNIFLSRIENPFGFPSWFNWTPSYSANGSMTWTSVSTTRSVFYLVKTTVFIEIYALGTTGGTVSTQLIFSLPIAPTTTNTQRTTGSVVDTAGFVGQLLIGTNCLCIKYDSTNYTLGANRGVIAVFSYRLD
jgi:hypothetical protein